MAIVLSIRRWFTDSYFSSCIFKLFFWLLPGLSFVDLRLLTSSLVSSNFSFGYSPVCPSLIYGFLLLLLYLQTFLLAIVLSVLCWFTTSCFSSCIFKLFFWLLSCLSGVDLRLLTSPLVSSNFSLGYCPVCPLLIYGFLLLFLYLQTFLLAIVLSVLCWFTDSYFSSCIFKLLFWLLSCLSVVDLRLLTSPLVSSNFSFGYCPVCPLLIYGFLLLLLYLQTFLLTIVLSVRRWFTDSYFSLVSSNFSFGYCPVCPSLIYGFLLLLLYLQIFFWLLSCLSVVDLRILTSLLVSSNFSFGYCPVCPLLIYEFLLLLLYLQAFLLALSCLSFVDLRLLTSPLVSSNFSFGNSPVCPLLIYGFLLLLLYLQTFPLAIVLSVLCWFTASYFSSCIFKLFFWLLSGLSFFDLRILTSPLVSSNFSFGDSPVCPLLIYGFLLLLLYLQTFLLAIVLSVRRWFTASYFSSCIFKLFFWLLSCLSFVDLRLLTSPLVSLNCSAGYSPICPSSIYGFLLLLLYLQTFLLAIVLSVLCWFTDSYFSSCIFKLFFWLLSCLSVVDLRLLTSPLVSSNFLLAIVLSVRRWFTDSYFSSCIFKLFFWLLSCLSFVNLQLLTSPLVSSNFSFGYCPVCPLLIYGFLFLLLYLQTFILAIVLSVRRWFTDSYFSSCIFKLFFWLLSCLSVVDLRLLTSPLVSSNFLLAIVLSVLVDLRILTSLLVSSNFSFGYCPVCPLLIYGFLLLLLYLQTFRLAIVLFVLCWFTDSYFSSCILKLFFSLLFCLSCVDLRFLLLLLYLQTFHLAIVLSVLCQFTDSYFSSCIFKVFFWLLSCLSFVDLRLLTSPLVSSNFSFGYCPVCPLLIYSFLLLLFYLQTFLLAIVLSVLCWFTASYFSSCIFKLFFWLLSGLSFFDLRILTSPLVSSNFSFGDSPVCPLLIYEFLLLLFYLQTFLLAIVLSVLCWFTTSYFSSCIFKLFFWL